MDNKIDKEKEFWDNKIIQWEDGRYLNKNNSFFEKLSDYFSSSLLFRRKKSLDFLKNLNVQNKIVYELGCGSGFLAKDILDLGASKYIGLDISSEAIDRANKINANLIKNNKCIFFCGRPNDFLDIEYDILFSLGFIDWIYDQEIDDLIKFTNLEKPFFHSFSALNKKSISQYFHRLYVYISYKRNKKLSPIYRSDNHIKNFFKTDYLINFYSSKKLNFGKFFGNIKFK